MAHTYLLMLVGYSVSLSSDGTVLPQVQTLNPVPRIVRVFQYNPGGGEGTGDWEQLGDNILGGSGDFLGYSVSLSKWFCCCRSSQLYDNS